MKICRFPFFLCFLLGWALAHAQTVPARMAAPRIGYVYPAGGRQGATLTVLVGGQYLKDVVEVEVTGAGIKGRVLDYEHPLEQKEVEELKQEAADLKEKRKASVQPAAAGATRPVWTPADEARAAYLRTRFDYRPNRQSAPAISEAVRVELNIGTEAVAGIREFRLRTANGLSNPLRFEVGLLPEFAEAAAAPNTAVPDMGDGVSRLPRPEGGGGVTLPIVANGQILPGEVDRLSFHARQGVNLLVHVEARTLIPYLADAVPGWFQAAISLVDSKGVELAYNDDFRFNPDPVLCYRIPAEGDYSVLIKDALFRGRQDFVYRMTIGELPFITSVYPLGGEAKGRSMLSLRGWNLPTEKAVVNAEGRAPGLLHIAVGQGGQASNEMLYSIGEYPECAEREPNDEPARAMPVSLPLTINGRIDQPGDKDVFSFQAKAGDEIVAEIFARRLNSPLDSLLVVSDVSGRQLAINDDHEDKGDGLSTHHADSRLQFKAPADGVYLVCVSDVQNQGGGAYAYRLQLAAPRPDFELRTVPSVVNVRSGLNAVVTVHALRRDGFTGEIRLGLAEPSGLFFLSGARIPAGQDHVRVTLGTRESAREASWPLTLVGQAEIGGKLQRRASVPAEDMMQAFAYRHLVVCAEGRVQVIGKEGKHAPAMTWLDKGAMRFHPGASAVLECSLRLGQQLGNFQFELLDPPAGIRLGKVEGGEGLWQLEVVVDPVLAKPGAQGNLIIQVSGERLGAGGQAKGKKGAGARGFAIGVLPAVPYEVVR